MRLTRRKNKGPLDPAELRLPLIALIDVVLFLLFFFIIAGNISAEESELSSTLQVQKQGQGRGGKLISQRLSVEPDASGAVVYRVGDRTIKNRQTLENLLAALPKDPGISIRVDPRLTTDAAAAAIQATRNAGFTKITYVTGN